MEEGAPSLSGSSTELPDTLGCKRSAATSSSDSHDQSRTKKAKPDRKNRLCSFVVQGDVASCPYDLKSSCYMFERDGRCPYGVTCRYGSAHIKDLRSIVNDSIESSRQSTELNKLPKDLQRRLRKKQEFKFSGRTGKDAKLSPNRELTLPESVVARNDSSDYVESSSVPREQKVVDWSNKLCLGSLTTVGNLPFRRVCKEFGADITLVDITLGEMAMAKNIVVGQPSEWALLRRHSSEDIFGVQLCGCRADELTKASELIQKYVSADFVDLNAGCPIDLVVNRGCGSALLEKPNRLQACIKSMSQILSCPVTVKLRTGREESAPLVHERIIPSLSSWGASAAFLHGRSRQQRYRHRADWNYVARCAQLSKVPVIGNGDVYSFEDYDRAKDLGVDSICIARGALIKPWVFTEIKEHRHWDITANERFDILKRFCNFGLEHWGSDSHGVSRTRHFLCEWMSFFHRYVPCGLLEVAPRINCGTQFRGRSDLETLLSSDKIDDWIRISEMILGSAQGFKYTKRDTSGLT